MIKRIVRMKFKPESVTEVLAVLETKVTSIRAREGCHFLEILQDIDDPTILFSYSYWTSQVHLDNYRASNLFGEVWPFLKRNFEEAPQANSVNVLHHLD